MTASASPVVREGAHAAPAVRRGVDWLAVLAALAVVGAIVRAVYFTPTELRQGLAQKIYYIHIPSALAAYAAFTLVALCSAMYLWLRDPRLDRVAESAAEVGIIFITAVLVTGPIWARPIWGTWWSGDARLQLTLFLWFVEVGYLVLRGAVEDPGQRARYSAVLGILGALLIPFIHLSVYMFRTMHPQPIVLKPSAPSLPGPMLTTLMLSFAAFMLMLAALLRARYRLAAVRDAADAEAAR